MTRILLLWTLFFSSTQNYAIANIAFPLATKKVQIISAKIEIKPNSMPNCFGLAYRGKNLKLLALKSDLPSDHELSYFQKQIECNKTDSSMTITHWTVDAQLDVKATEDVIDIEIGLFTPDWLYPIQSPETKDCCKLHVASIVNPVMKLDGHEIKSPDLRWLDLDPRYETKDHDDNNPKSDKKKVKPKFLHYVWKGSFWKDTPQKITLHYEFTKEVKGKTLFTITPIRLWGVTPTQTTEVVVNPSHAQSQKYKWNSGSFPTHEISLK